MADNYVTRGDCRSCGARAPDKVRQRLFEAQKDGLVEPHQVTKLRRELEQKDRLLVERERENQRLRRKPESAEREQRDSTPTPSPSPSSASGPDIRALAEHLQECENRFGQDHPCTIVARDQCQRARRENLEGKELGVQIKLLEAQLFKRRKGLEGVRDKLRKAESTLAEVTRELEQAQEEYAHVESVLRDKCAERAGEGQLSPEELLARVMGEVPEVIRNAPALEGTWAALRHGLAQVPALAAASQAARAAAAAAAPDVPDAAMGGPASAPGPAAGALQGPRVILPPSFIPGASAPATPGAGAEGSPSASQSSLLAAGAPAAGTPDAGPNDVLDLTAEELSRMDAEMVERLGGQEQARAFFDNLKAVGGTGAIRRAVSGARPTPYS